MHTHDGTVTKITANKIEIQFQQDTMCLHCQIKNTCMVSHSRPRILHTKIQNPQDYHVGDKVIIEISPQSSLWALFFGYALPLMVLLIGSITCHILGLTDTLNALTTLFVLLLYYLVLGINQKKLSDKFQIKVHK